MIQCTNCGAKFNKNDVDQHAGGTGCWCPLCETFIWFTPKEKTQMKTILLEQNNQSKSQKEKYITFSWKFKKRLSPLRYPGGKSKLIDYLFAKLQPSKCETFVEVFAGGASFGLSLLDAGVIKKLVLNDADKNLINFWNEVFYNPEPLLHKLKTITPSHSDYEEAKKKLNSNVSTGPTERAWAYLLVNRLSYSGIQKAGCLGGRGGSTEALLSRYNPKMLEKQISHLATLKDRVKLLNKDYSEVIETYYWDDKTTLFIVIYTPRIGSSLSAFVKTNEIRSSQQITCRLLLTFV